MVVASGDEACIECIARANGVDDINREARLPDRLIAKARDSAIGSEPCNDQPIITRERRRSLDGIRKAGKGDDLVDRGPQNHVRPLDRVVDHLSEAVIPTPVLEPEIQVERHRDPELTRPFHSAENCVSRRGTPEAEPRDMEPLCVAD